MSHRIRPPRLWSIDDKMRFVFTNPTLFTALLLSTANPRHPQYMGWGSTYRNPARP